MVYFCPLLWLFLFKIVILKWAIAQFKTFNLLLSVLFQCPNYASSLYLLCIHDYSFPDEAAQLPLQRLRGLYLPIFIRTSQSRPCTLYHPSLLYHSRRYLKVRLQREKSESGIICFEGEWTIQGKVSKLSYPYTFTSQWKLCPDRSNKKKWEVPERKETEFLTLCWMFSELQSATPLKWQQRGTGWRSSWANLIASLEV